MWRPSAAATAPFWPSPMAMTGAGRSAPRSNSSPGSERLPTANSYRMNYVQADFSVELGADDPSLQIPWSSSDPRVQYYDLRSHPELLPQIVETQDNEALAEFL